MAYDRHDLNYLISVTLQSTKKPELMAYSLLCFNSVLIMTSENDFQKLGMIH
jgi:hypothetical protein